MTKLTLSTVRDLIFSLVAPSESTATVHGHFVAFFLVVDVLIFLLKDYSNFDGI